MGRNEKTHSSPRFFVLLAIVATFSPPRQLSPSPVPMADDGECPKRMLEERCKPACTKYALAYEVRRQEEIEGCGVGFGGGRRLHARVFGSPLAVCGTGRGLTGAAPGRPNSCRREPMRPRRKKTAAFARPAVSFCPHPPTASPTAAATTSRASKRGWRRALARGRACKLNTHHPHFTTTHQACAKRIENNPEGHCVGQVSCERRVGGHEGIRQPID